LIPAPPDIPPTPDPLPTDYEGLRVQLDRPAEQRAREYQYRFAQSAVFGLPVLLLQAFGHSLGGPESDRWVAVFQAVLAGWIVYVGAAGMLFESLLWLTRRRMTADLLPSLAAAGLYLVGVARLASHIIQAGIGAGSASSGDLRSTFPPMPFHWSVLLLVAWSGTRWWSTSKGPPQPERRPVDPPQRLRPPQAG
jgi:cation transport ATPase